jgi:hypothetical protein
LRRGECSAVIKSREDCVSNPPTAMPMNADGTNDGIPARAVEAPVVRLVPLSTPMSGWWAAGPAIFEEHSGLVVGEAGAWIGSVLSMTRAPDFEGPGGGWHGF